MASVNTCIYLTKREIYSRRLRDVTYCKEPGELGTCLHRAAYSKRRCFKDAHLSSGVEARTRIPRTNCVPGEKVGRLRRKAKKTRSNDSSNGLLGQRLGRSS